MRRVVTTLAGMLAIVLIAASLGYAFPTEDPTSSATTFYSWPQAVPSTPASITLAELKERMDRGERVVLLDARPADEYMIGHISGALSLPALQIEQLYPAFSERFSRDVELVVYCDGPGCNSSLELSKALIEKGFSQVKVLPEGWQAWLASEYPIERGGG